MKILWLAVGAGSVVVLYILWVVIQAWVDTKGAPRKEMFFCNIHGPMLKEHAISFLGTDNYCSICFHEKMRAAERSGRI